MPAALRNTLLTALMALIFGFLGAATWSYSGLADARTQEFLISNPDMLPKMAEAYQAQEAQKRLADIGEDIYAPFSGAIRGNPNGSKILVKFTDYNCIHCESSLADVDQLISEDPDLKVIFREFPLFDGSEAAARMALAAGMQGKYEAFHLAMFERTPVTPDSLLAAANAAGIDMAKAEADMASEAVTVEIAKNFSFAQTLGFDGTPAWIAAGKPISGAVGYERLKEALNNPPGASEG